MAITAFVGTPGSGKSYDAVAKIVDNLRMGRRIYTNIRGMNDFNCLQQIQMLTGLSDSHLLCYLNFLTDEEAKCFWDHVAPGSMIVLDEVQNIFNARDWAKKENGLFNAWASTHRHMGFDLLLITQSMQRLDTAVRSLVQFVYLYRKLDFFGKLFTKKYLVYAYADQEVTGPPLSKAVRTYDKRIFFCYQSYMFKDMKEQGIMKHVNVLNHPIFYAIPIVFGYFIYMAFQSGMLRGDLFGANKQFDKLKKSPTAVAAPASPHKSYSVHTPSIWTASTKSGQTLFSNRGSDEAAKNDKDKKNDEKAPKKT